MLGASSSAHESLKPQASRKLMHRNDLLAVQSSLPFFIIGFDTCDSFCFYLYTFAVLLSVPLALYLRTCWYLQRPPLQDILEQSPGTLDASTEFLLQRWLPCSWHIYLLFLSFSPAVSFVSSSFSHLYFSLHQTG